MKIIDLFTAIFLSISSLFPVSKSLSPVITISPAPALTPLTLNSIFRKNSQNSMEKNDRIISLITTGDVIPARSVNFKMVEKNDFTYPFAKTAQFLKSADLTLINLEAPLISDCPVTNQGMIFCGDQRFVEGLKYADIDIVNLANNHSFNHGETGLCETILLLERNNIGISGTPESLNCPFTASNFYTKIVKGFKFGFLGFNILDNPPVTKILNAVKSAKNKSDFLVISFHWGAEYESFPAKQTVELAKSVIDSGADLIVGNHPHWIQPLEIYKEKLIIYAHGNFIFDQEWSRETKKGFASKIIIYKNKIIDVQIYPVFISDYSEAELLEGKRKEDILNHLEEISQKQSR